MPSRRGESDALRSSTRRSGRCRGTSPTPCHPANFPESGTNVDSIVTDVDPPRLIECSWSSRGEPDRPLRWEAAAVNGGTRLSLTLRIPDNEDIARTCAGWEAHLEMLAAAMEGVPIKFPFERFKAAREAYRELLPSIRRG
ncbi:SRPBCC domain-containing protein [Bradyrhizobium sp.]|uniref:SRPBCC domain-containing protein n=1 Tax=Bradyrhizobium sp. TaxID=376 RepID=UPI00351F7A24